MKQITFYITGFIVLSALLTSCVSKKKFDELARAKRMSDREIASLQNEKQNMEAEIQQLKSDFNAVRYQLTLNNAAKDKQIDELSSSRVCDKCADDNANPSANKSEKKVQ